MSDYRFCHGCSNAMPPEKFTDYHEPDVGYHGLMCECGAVDDFDEMDAAWALDQIKRAYRCIRTLSNSGKKDPYMLNVADRLSAAEDELEAAVVR